MDTDNYTRLAKLQEVWRHGGWFDPVQYRVAPPLGHSTHWSKPLDIILVVGALPLAALFGFVKALFFWGVVVSPIAYVGTVLFSRWMSQPVLEMRRDWLAAALLATQWSILGGLAFGRPDHNVVLLPCFMAMIGFTLRILVLGPSRSWALALGAASSLGVWTSIEFLIAVALTMATFGLAWLVRRPRMAEMGMLMSGATTLGIMAAIALEKGPHRLAELTLDQISWPFLVMFLALTGAWAVLCRIERSGRPAAIVARAGCAALAVAIAGLIVWLIVPELLAGPLSMVDPLYRVTRLEIINEYMPVINAERYGWLANTGRAIYVLLYPAISIVLALYYSRHADPGERWAFVYLFLAGATYFVLNVQGMHWGVYTAIIAVPVFTRFARVVLSWIEAGASELTGMLMRVVFMVLLLFGSPLIGNSLITMANVGSDGRVYRICNYSASLDTLNDPAGIGASPRRLVAFVDFNPELLYRTPHYVYSVPNHRPQPGYTGTYELMSEADMTKVPSRLADLKAEYLLICVDKSESAFYWTVSEARNFHDRLSDGENFNFLEIVPLPPEASQLRLYKVLVPAS